MHNSIVSLLLSALFATSIAAPAPPPSSSLPSCDPSYNYNKLNKTLRLDTLNEIDVISTQAQMTGASVHILGYAGYGQLIPGIVQPMTDSLTGNWTPTLNSIQIKCPACKAANGSIEHAHVRKYPILSYQILYDIFDITTNMLLALDANQCSVPGFTPSAAVQAAMRPFIDAIWGAMGTGPASELANVPKSTPQGAIYPFYDCLDAHASSNVTGVFTGKWFELAAVLAKINGTGCVVH